MNALALRAICVWSLCVCLSSVEITRGLRVEIGNRTQGSRPRRRRRSEPEEDARSILIGERGAFVKGGRDEFMPEWVPEVHRGEYDRVIARAHAWFDVVESRLEKVDYQGVPQCTTKKDLRGKYEAYINAVIHIQNRSWTTTCGDLSNTERGPPLVDILDKIVPQLAPEVDVHLPFGLHDGVQNVHENNQNVPVLGTIFHEAYSEVTIPFAMGCIRDPNGKAYMNNPVVGWDKYVKTLFTCKSSNASINKAVFRGKATHRSKRYGACCGQRCTPACDFKENGRLFVHYLGLRHPEIFDAVVSNVAQFKTPLPKVNAEDAYLDLPEQLCNYRAILNIGNNADWAERLRQSFYGNAVVMIPERFPQEFFTSFMEPKKTYWPIKSDLSDIVEQVTYVTGMNDTSELLQGQKEFAAKYLSEGFMLFYNRIVIEEYFARVQRSKNNQTERMSGDTLAKSMNFLNLGSCESWDYSKCPPGMGPA